jgi:large subunit ribosomal protein L30
MSGKIKITQVRSTIGRIERQKRTMRALGIKKIGSSVVRPDTQCIRGMINTVKHLVTTESVDGE